MRWTLGLIAPVLVAAITIAPLPANASTPAVAAPASATSDEFTAANFASVNSQRAAAGVAPLQMQTWAEGVAQVHSLDMANAGDIFHNMTGYMALGRSAMGASYLGENVAMGTNLDYAQNALITSPLHRKNTLDPRFNFVGIGAATDAAGQVYITEDFAQINGGSAQPAAPGAPIQAPVVVPTPKPVAAPVTVAAPRPAVAPKPVVAPRVAASTPAVAPKPAVAASAPAKVALVSAPAGIPAAAAAPAIAPISDMKVAAHPASMKPAILLLYGILALLGLSFTLGLGYKLTRFLPGR